MSDSTSSSLVGHSLEGPSPNRSLASASFAHHHQPTSPFSSQQLSADAAALAPPVMMRGSLYPHQPAAIGGFEPEETHVYRSVTIDSQAIGGGHGFDPLASFDHSFTAHHKDLSLNPKSAAAAASYSYAAYQPTLNFATVQSDFAKLTTAVQQPSAAVVAPSVAVAAHTQPPLAPVWLEPNSHFFCSCPPPSTPADLFETITSVLQSLHEGGASSSICTLDCTPQPNRYKLTCTAYQRRSGAATPFIVRLFTTDDSHDANKLCVEFQRRGQSDVVHFYELFRTARTRIQAAYPCQDDTAGQTASGVDSLQLNSLDSGLAPPHLSLRSWSAPPLPAELDIGVSAADPSTSMCDTVRSLLAMCTSPCFDVKLQGLTALAELSATPMCHQQAPAMRAALISEGCFQLFLDCLPLECADIHRASLTALANLFDVSVDGPHHLRLCKQLVQDESSLQRLYALSGSETHQVARECARVLSACATNLGPELWTSMTSPHATKVLKQTIQRLNEHQDSSCRQHAAMINRCVA